MASKRPERITDKFGLDFLTKGHQERKSDAGADETQQRRREQPMSSTDEAQFENLQAFATRELLVSIGKLEQQHAESGEPSEQGVYLREVAEVTNMDARVMLPLVDLGESVGLVEIRDFDTFGNHRVVLTSISRKLIGVSDDRTLMRIIEAGMTA